MPRSLIWLLGFSFIGVCAGLAPSRGLGAEANLVAGSIPASGTNVTSGERKRFVLKPDQAWRLTPAVPAPHLGGKGQAFDASGLLLLPDGRLYTVNDKTTGLYQIKTSMVDGGKVDGGAKVGATNFVASVGEAMLEKVPNWFTDKQLEPFKAQKKGHYDLEGIARDAAGRIYVCEEGNRWVLRLDPKTETVERLPIEWPAEIRKKYFSDDPNASWEGIAVSHGLVDAAGKPQERLYLANERSRGRIIVLDLNTLRVISDFGVGAVQLLARDMHYTDLCWFDGYLYVLMREARVVLQVDPKTERAVAEFDVTALESAPEHAYHRLYPTGILEGLAVDAEHFWIVTDNNGYGRLKDAEDKRPTLFRCPRPGK